MIEQCPREHQQCEGKLRAYEVLTPYYETGGDGYYEPSEWTLDYRLVYARNARRAKVLAVRAWRRMNTMLWNGARIYPWLNLQYWTKSTLASKWIEWGENPFSGLRAYRMPTVEWIEEQADALQEAENERQASETN